jgi:HPt (histidine-containing phosphotransfer) domain-containing protein
VDALGSATPQLEPATDALLDRFLGDRSLLLAVAETFIDHLPVLLGDVDAAVAARDLQAVERAAHSLKGSAGNFGYAPAFEAALHLEQLGGAGASEGMTEASATVHRTMAELVRRLREAIAEPVVAP